MLGAMPPTGKPDPKFGRNGIVASTRGPGGGYAMACNVGQYV